jgi:putative oxidoreductase
MESAGRRLAGSPNRRIVMSSNGGSMTSSIGLLVLRVGVAGLLFCAHGWGKITHIADRAKSFPDPLHLGSTPSFWLVVLAEVFCTPLVALGLFTRAATIPIIGFLSVAFFIHHAADPFPRRELAVLFLIPFVALFFTGPGRFALDAWIKVKVQSKGGGD